METAIQRQNDWTRRLNYYLAPSLLVAADFVAVCLAIYTALYLRDIIAHFLEIGKTALSVRDAYFYMVMPTLYVGFIAYAELYSRRMMFYQWTEILFKIATYICVMVIIVAYLVGMVEPVSRMFMLLFWILSFVYLCIARYATKRSLHEIGIWQRPVVVVGAGKTAEILTETFEKDSGIGYRIVGFVEDHLERPLLKKYPRLGGFENVEEIIKRTNVQDVILATPGLKRKDMVKLFYRIQPLVRNLTIVPDVFGVPIGNIHIDGWYNEKTVLMKVENNLRKRRNRVIKRCFDIVVGIGIFVCIAPLLVILALCIKLDTKGPALHIAKRIGKNGELFDCYKFRTMYMNGDEMLKEYLENNPEQKEEWERFAKLRTVDPRVTKVGKVLRKLSLDELPQIVNVLMGNMSLVGPRPYLPREKEKIGEYLHTICLTMPGITGLWQVSGRNEIDFRGRLRLDAWYVRNWSIWQDVILLVKTVKVVMGREGAY